MAAIRGLEVGLELCCRKSAEDHIRRTDPYIGLCGELTDHLVSLIAKWGSAIEGLLDCAVIQCSASPKVGVNANIYAVSCNTCSNQNVPIIIIGANFLYFTWRLGLICATRWQAASKIENGRFRISYSDDWPQQEQVDQVFTCLDMYFGKKWLTTAGLDEIKYSIANLNKPSLSVHLAIIDMAELFILLHEFQHLMPLVETSQGEFGIRLDPDLGGEIEITPGRSKRWLTELTHDANAMLLLFMSVKHVLVKRGMTEYDAKIQAGSIVFAGADAALHTLHVLEIEKHGEVSLQDAADRRGFVKHPPSGFRRNRLSNVGFIIFTGRPITDLISGFSAPDWNVVAGNVAANMATMDCLIAAYRSRSGHKQFRTEDDQNDKHR